MKKQRWYDKPAGPGLHLILFAVIGAAMLIVLSGCGGIDTTRPDHTIRLFETRDQIDRKHELRMQSLRDRHRARIHRRHRY